MFRWTFTANSLNLLREYRLSRIELQFNSRPDHRHKIGLQIHLRQNPCLPPRSEIQRLFFPLQLAIRQRLHGLSDIQIRVLLITGGHAGRRFYNTDRRTGTTI